MKLTFSIPDDLYEHYEAKAAPGTSVNLHIKETLDRFKDAPPAKDRPIMLGAADRRRVESVMDSTVDSGKEMADLVERLATIGLGEYTYQFTVDQLTRLEEQAESYGIDLPQYLELVMERFFDYRCNL